MNITIYMYLVLGRIFKDKEGIHAYQYNIAIM